MTEVTQMFLQCMHQRILCLWNT